MAPVPIYLGWMAMAHSVKHDKPGLVGNFKKDSLVAVVMH
jgi:hypothetical protein